MSAVTMTGYMGAITTGAPFIMDYGQKDVEELVRVSDVQPADDVCCKVRLEGTTFWMPEIEFRRRATPFIPATPSQRLDAATVERCGKIADLIDAQAKALEGYAEGNGFSGKAPASVFHWQATHFRDLANDLRRALATEPHQHGGKA